MDVLSPNSIQMIPAFEVLRFRYEYGGESIADICMDVGYPIADVTEYAICHSWQVQADPDYNDEGAVNQFYSKARAKMTVAVTRRAMSLYPKLIAIEDAVLSTASLAIEAIDTTNTDVSAGLELSRLGKIIDSIGASTKLYSQAIAVPALHDSNIIELVRANDPKTVEEACKILKERGIPTPLDGLSLADVGDL